MKALRSQRAIFLWTGPGFGALNQLMGGGVSPGLAGQVPGGVSLLFARRLF